MTASCGGGWCGRCYTNVRGRTNHKGHRGYRRPRTAPKLKAWEVREMQRPKGYGTDGSDLGEPAKGDMFSGRPELWALLTDDEWEDGGRRQRATLLIMCDGPVAKVWINDRATERTAWGTGETVEAALDQLEEQLATGIVPWRTGEGKRTKKS